MYPYIIQQLSYTTKVFPHRSLASRKVPSRNVETHAEKSHKVQTKPPYSQVLAWQNPCTGTGIYDTIKKRSKRALPNDQFACLTIF